jgi:hypothetical protein
MPTGHESGFIGTLSFGYVVLFKGRVGIDGTLNQRAALDKQQFRNTSNTGAHVLNLQFFRQVARTSPVSFRRISCRRS